MKHHAVTVTFFLKDYATDELAEEKVLDLIEYGADALEARDEALALYIPEYQIVSVEEIYEQE